MYIVLMSVSHNKRSSKSPYPPGVGLYYLLSIINEDLWLDYY